VDILLDEQDAQAVLLCAGQLGGELLRDGRLESL
jgi:hypothetical protein